MTLKEFGSKIFSFGDAHRKASLAIFCFICGFLFAKAFF